MLSNKIAQKKWNMSSISLFLKEILHNESRFRELLEGGDCITIDDLFAKNHSNNAQTHVSNTKKRKTKSDVDGHVIDDDSSKPPPAKRKQTTSTQSTTSRNILVYNNDNMITLDIPYILRYITLSPSHTNLLGGIDALLNIPNDALEDFYGTLVEDITSRISNNLLGDSLAYAYSEYALVLDDKIPLFVDLDFIWCRNPKYNSFNSDLIDYICILIQRVTTHFINHEQDCDCEKCSFVLVSGDYIKLDNNTSHCCVPNVIQSLILDAYTCHQNSNNNQKTGTTNKPSNNQGTGTTNKPKAKRSNSKSSTSSTSSIPPTPSYTSATSSSLSSLSLSSSSSYYTPPIIYTTGNILKRENLFASTSSLTRSCSQDALSLQCDSDIKIKKQLDHSNNAVSSDYIYGLEEEETQWPLFCQTINTPLSPSLSLSYSQTPPQTPPLTLTSSSCTSLNTTQYISRSNENSNQSTSSSVLNANSSASPLSFLANTFNVYGKIPKEYIYLHTATIEHDALHENDPHEYKLGVHLHFPHLFLTYSQILELRALWIECLTNNISLNCDIVDKTLLKLNPNKCNSVSVSIPDNIDDLRSVWNNIIDVKVYGNNTQNNLPHIRLPYMERYAKPCDECTVTLDNAKPQHNNNNNNGLKRSFNVCFGGACQKCHGARKIMSSTQARHELRMIYGKPAWFSSDILETYKKMLEQPINDIFTSYELKIDGKNMCVDLFKYHRFKRFGNWCKSLESITRLKPLIKATIQSCSLRLNIYLSYKNNPVNLTRLTSRSNPEFYKYSDYQLTKKIQDDQTKKISYILLYPKFNKLIEKIIQEHRINNVQVWKELHITHISLLAGKSKDKSNGGIGTSEWKITVVGIGARYCNNVLRTHSKSNVYFHMSKEGICQKCKSETRQGEYLPPLICSKNENIHTIPWPEDYDIINMRKYLDIYVENSRTLLTKDTTFISAQNALYRGYLNHIKVFKK